MAKFLDYQGLTQFWAKIKTWVYTAVTTNSPSKSKTVTGMQDGKVTYGNIGIDASQVETGKIPIGRGGTNATSASGARSNLDVYSKSEVDSMLTGRISVVATLPASGTAGVIYYVGPSGSGSDQYEEYIWDTTNSQFIKVGEKSLDLTQYVNTLTSSGSGGFVTGMSKNGNEITFTLGTLPDATTAAKGIVQLAGSIGSSISSENNKAASEKAVRDAINALDSNKTSSDGTNVQVKVTISDGKVSAVNITTDNTENKNNKVTTWSSTTTDAHYPSETLVKKSLDSKADKVSDATSGNFAIFDAIGNITDIGKKASDFATAAQGTKADSAVQGVKLADASSALTPDSSKVVTIPNAVATGTTGATNGLMTAADKQKLDGIASGAEVNQNAFSNVKVGSTTVAADSKTDTLTLVAGGAVTITPDATNDNITISSTDQSVTDVGNHYTPAEDSSAEKDASGGSATQLPTSSTGTMVQVVTGVKMDAKGHVTGVVSKGLWSPNTTYTNETLGQGYGTCSTAEATAAKAVTLSDYVLVKGGVVAVKFTYGLCASATLNINSKGAKKVFINGAAVTSTTANMVKAGDIAYFMYDGTQYQFLGTDRMEKDAVTGFSDAGTAGTNAKVRYTKGDGTTGDLMVAITNEEIELLP